MRKQKTKRSMVGFSLLAVMGITLLAPGAGMNEIKATSTPSDAEIEADVAASLSDAGIEENAAALPSDVEIEVSAASTPSDAEMMYAAPTAPIAIDSTTFPDDVFREWVKDNCDENSDGQLSEDERLHCKQIQVNNKEIASLKGIEFFPNLTLLNCNDNNLSSLDVNKNTILTELYCGNNNLGGLDVSNNTALTCLGCYGNNLSNLDVSNNTALVWLNFHTNNISSLDLSKCKALTQLYCDYNNLGSLDISNNMALMWLHCNYNNLSSLDVSNNTALEQLRCSNNNLSSLDVSNNTALTWLNCSYNNLSSLDVSNLALTDLACYNNNLSSLDVSNNIALVWLSCGNNNLSQLDVSKTQNLEELYYDNNALCSLDLSKNTKLQKLGSNDQIVSVPMYKNGDEYYIDLSELPLDLKRVSIDEALGETDGVTYDSTSGRINLSKTKNVKDRVQYLYETNGPTSLSNTKITVTLEISEVRDITAPTQTDNSKDASPKTGDTAPLYPVIFLLLASFAGGVTLYMRRKQQ